MITDLNIITRILKHKPRIKHKLKFKNTKNTVTNKKEGIQNPKMVEFLELESQDGVRMPWNMIPGTKQESSNCIVLVFAIYSPIRPLLNITLLPSFPLCCRTCCFVLDPFAIVDFAAKIWICLFCF